MRLEDMSDEELITRCSRSFGTWHEFYLKEVIRRALTQEEDDSPYCAGEKKK